MADPNQTPKRGNWACPCNGCQKAMVYEREQIIYFLKHMKDNDSADQFYDMVIDMIRSRNPKPKVKK